MQNLQALGTAEADVEYSDPSKLVRTPLVSVDMITYQHAPFIREALDSVLAQKVNFPYEICIGEDGSTDGTREICLEYAKAHPNKVRLFLRNRANPARKLFKAPYMHNAAATYDACRGKYIAMLEGDDYWLNPHKLQSQVEQLEFDPNLAASCHYALTVRPDQPWSTRVIPEIPLKSFAVEDVLKRDVLNIHTSTWLLRRSKPMNWEWFRVSSFGDYPLLVWALFHGSAVVLPSVWSVYRVHGNGVFGPLSDVTRIKNNLDLWQCFKPMVPSHLQPAVELGIARTLNTYTGELRKAAHYSSALGAFRTTLSEIKKLQISASDRMRFRWLALESLLCPRFRGVRNRLSRLPMPF